MPAPPRPPDEDRRLETVRLYDILDSESEAIFDDLTKIAAHLLDVPIALITIVDDQRQWFKSKVGTEVTETPRDQAFCAYAILDDQTLEVPDAERDPRFSDNPLVTAEPRIRFYAGAPLITPEGDRLGTLCVIDQETRTLTPAQRITLESLARVVTDALVLRRRLSEKGEFLNAVLDHVTDGIVACDADGKITLFNRATREFHGVGEKPIPPEEWSSYYSLLRTDGTPLPIEEVPLFRALRGEAVVDAGMVIRSVQGRETLISADGQQLKGSTGRRIGAMVVMHDLTSARLAEQERIARSEEEASRKAAEDHLARTRLLDRINRQLASTFDFERALRAVADELVPEVADLCSFDLVEGTASRNVAARHVSPEKQEAFLELRLRYPVLAGASIGAGAVLASGASQWLPSLSPQKLEDLALDTEQHLQWLRGLEIGSLIVVPLTVRNQTIGAMTLARSEGRSAFAEIDNKGAQDIADRIALFGENHRLHRELEIASKAKDEFLATLSHELRTPLTAILGWVQIAADEPGNLETALAALQSIGESARAQKHLIEEALDVSRVITGKMHLTLRDLDFVQLAAASVEALRPTAVVKSIDLRFEAHREACTILGDPDRLRQVIWNLVSNAVKFTPAGGTVEVRMERDGGQARLRVHDSGMGIAANELPFIFDNFRQSPAARQHGGLGLGLAIVRELVELHGGGVTASSAGEGQGSTFELWLPLQNLTASAELPEERSGQTVQRTGG
ncbi:MAG: ATP-binding protein [Thermoanaerobaculia bacterium]